MYQVTENFLKELENRFTYHAPASNQVKRYFILRKAVLTLATEIVTLTPPSREQSIALTKLDEVMFFANASIARTEKVEENV